MKTKLLLTIVIVLVSASLAAQDFAPSQQAQGYLDSKNVSVDYATGLFHYQVPIYTLKSGDFKLPISLNYVGKGVKTDDVPGLVGYNWTLNTGGIVTRTIRGGIADEEPTVGYIYQTFGTMPTAAQIEKVNKREIDGESDIFTAVFNGQSVNFIIKRVGLYDIEVEPLERTNVKIVCERLGPEIIGWIITDENGNKYIFEQKEWSANIVKEDAISFNGVRNKSYVSSWHISKIEPRNCAPIVFNYKADVNPYISGPQEDVNEVTYNSGYASKYTYGSSLQNRPFDFSKYRQEFERLIQSAKSDLNGFSMEAQLNNSLMEFQYVSYWARSPFFENMNDIITANFRVMGQLSNFNNLGVVTNEVIEVLNQLYLMYIDYPSSNAKMAAYSFRDARKVLIRCVEETEQLFTQEVGNISSIKMKSPILKSILCNNNAVRFDYRKVKWNNYNHMLKTITIEDAAKNNIVEVRLTNSDRLTQLSFYDKNEVESDRIQFDYFGVIGMKLSYDIWGFHKNGTSGLYNQNVDEECSKIKSLSRITTSNRGEIAIDYEPNVIPNRYSPSDLTVKFGGIRIKSIVSKEPITGVVDSIKYVYPYPGELVYSESYNRETVSYSGFSDNVIHSRAKQFGNAFIKTGNNGVYYNYVEEIFVGNGKKTYLFLNPLRMQMPFHMPYRFWVNGLPLGIATYDESGNLKSIVKHHYYGDLIPMDGFIKRIPELVDLYETIFNSNWFISATQANFSIEKMQIKAYEYYLDYNDLLTYYQSQNNVFLYRDGNISYVINPYIDVFLPNVAPRTNVVLPQQTWSLIYGGKILPRAQIEYRIEGNFSTGSSINHFVADLGANASFKRTEYSYDNLNYSIAPTRISTTDSKGDIYTSVIRKIVDMNTSGVVSIMKDHNILYPIVKIQNLVNGKLQREEINVYSSETIDNKSYFGVVQEKVYYPVSNNITPSFPERDNALYGYDQQNYTEEKNISYIYNGGYYVPAGVSDKRERISLCYDFSLNVPILEAKTYTHKHISAVNSCYHNFEFNEENNPYIQMMDMGSVEEAYAFMTYFEQQNNPGHLYSYFISQEFITMKKLLEGLVTRFRDMSYSEFNLYQNAFLSNPGWLGIYMNQSKPWYLTGGHSLDVYLPLNMLSKIEMTNDTYSLLGFKDESSINITQFSTPTMKLYVVSKSSVSGISYSVTHSGGTSIGYVKPSYKADWNVQVLDIDLSEYSAITSVAINHSSAQNIAYLALVPSDCEFEATSYNLDGTVFCKFDQTGQMERYEYDGAGRVIKILDGDGMLLKENTYNFNFPN